MLRLRLCFAREPSVTGRNFARDLSNPIGICFGFRLTQLRKKSKTSDNGRVLLRWHGLPALIRTTALGGTTPSGCGRRAMGLLTRARRHIMPRSCTVCTHERRYDIDSILVDRLGSYRDIVVRFGVSKTAIGRHVSEGHISELLALASDAERAAHADGLLDRVEALQSRTEEALAKAESSDNLFATFRGITEMRRNLELIGEVTKELNRTPTLNLALNPEYIELRTAILAAVGPHPEAAASISRAMREIENAHER